MARKKQIVPPSYNSNQNPGYIPGYSSMLTTAFYLILCHRHSQGLQPRNPQDESGWRVRSVKPQMSFSAPT